MVTATEPQVADKAKYSTKEAYEALGVSRSAFAAYVAKGRTVFVLTGYNNGEVFDVTRT